MTVNTNEKKCTRCKKIHPATPKYFHRNKAEKDGLCRWCKTCKNAVPPSSNRTEVLSKYNNSAKGAAAQRKYRRTDKGKALNRRAKLKYYYNMTTDDYNGLFQQQKGCCAICGKHQSEIKWRLAIDHDHNTNEIRGLLCRPCNSNLGRFEKGRKFNPLLTHKFMEYLYKNV